MVTAAAERIRQRGTKRSCLACEVRFYDLGRDPVVCPSCQSSSPLAAFAKPEVAPSTGYRGQSFWGQKRAAPRPILQNDDQVEVEPDAISVDADVDGDAVPEADDKILETEEELDDDVAILPAPDEETPSD